jgi:predicted dehydrogenase
VIGIGVVGFGYWGPNLVRNFSETKGAALRGVCDQSPAARERIAQRFPGVKVFSDAKEMFADPGIDAVVIATPVTSHFPLADMALDAGKCVLVEKPMTLTADESKRLVDKAARLGKVLMVDHTFVYTGAVRKMRELIDRGEVGDVLYYDSVRVNLGLFQSVVNVIWDLAPHDLSILTYLAPNERTVAVSATGVSHVAGRPENTAYLTLHFDGAMLGHVHVNWLAPVKIRQTIVGGSKKMIVYNDLETTEKLKIYDRGIELTRVEENPEAIHRLKVGYRSGDMFAPRCDEVEALRVEAAHFVECVSKNARPLTDGEAGLRVVEILEAANRSLASGGREIIVR